MYLHTFGLFLTRFFGLRFSHQPNLPRILMSQLIFHKFYLTLGHIKKKVRCIATFLLGMLNRHKGDSNQDASMPFISAVQLLYLQSENTFCEYKQWGLGWGGCLGLICWKNAFFLFCNTNPRVKSLHTNISFHIQVVLLHANRHTFISLAHKFVILSSRIY